MTAEDFTVAFTCACSDILAEREESKYMEEQMATLKEEAQAYEPPQTKNITDLDVVPTEADIYTKKFKEGTADEFEIKVITLNNEDYRVPNSVLANLKAILEANPSLKHFKVTKTGTGLKTQYTVIPLE